MLTLADARAIARRRRRSVAPALVARFPIGGAMSSNDRHSDRPDAFISPLVIDDAVPRALDEDLGRAGDVTSIATVPDGTRGRADVVARKAGTIAGLPLVEAAFRKLDPVDQDRGPCARRRHGRGQDRADDDRRRRARDARRPSASRSTSSATCPASRPRPPNSCAASRTRSARVCCTRKTTPGLRALREIRGALRRRLQSPLRAR